VATTAAKTPTGAIYEVAAGFAADLEATQTAAVDQMLAAWADSYGRVRLEYDLLLQKVAAAKAAGVTPSPAWLYQQERLKAALATTKTEVHRFAEHASAAARQAQYAAVAAGAKHAAKLGQTAMTDAGLAGTFVALNPDNLQHLVGFLADGSPLADLFAGLGDEAAGAARHVLVNGMSLGKGVDWMRRRLADSLDLTRTRAETIVRTEAHRVYRSVARQTYLANDDVVNTWVWHAHLDARTCPACMVMDGTEHPLTAILDGHPRCRCAMVPRTKSWEDLLGKAGADLPDTRPPVRKGTEWFATQSAGVQRAILGPAKFRAWQAGKITLDDLVARPHNPQWGTMRRERSLREVRAGLNPNYTDAAEVVRVPPPRTANPKAARAIAATQTLDEVEAALAGESLTTQQVLDYQAAKVIHLNQLEYGPARLLPKPDPAKVSAATDKMNAAVLTKGYPSKGYSQTVAIYKAQANGTVGTKVGVVKSLTWEQKVNAQAALAAHQEWLATWTAQQAQAQAIAKDLWIKVDALWKDALDQSTGNPANKVAGWGQTATKFADLLPDGPAKTRLQAAITARLEAHAQSVADAKAFGALADQWEHPGGGAYVTVGDDGWGVLDDAHGGTPLSPAEVVKTLNAPGWAPVVEPDPAMVKSVIAAVTDADGYLSPAQVKVYEDFLPHANPKDTASITQGLAEAKATLPWKPEPKYVADLLTDLKSGAMSKSNLLDQAAKAHPQGKANAAQAISEYEDWLAAQAKAAAPDPDSLAGAGYTVEPKPQTVAMFLDDLASGGMTEQALYLYAKGGTGWASNKTKAAAWQALQDWKAKGKTAGGPPPGIDLAEADDALVWDLVEQVNQGQVSLQDLVDVYTSPHHTPSFRASAWKAWKALNPDTTPPMPVPAAPAPAPAALPGFGAAPDVATLKDTGKVLGTHGAKVYEGPDGTRYLYKPPKDPGDGFLATLDEAASIIQSKAGLKAPDTWVVSLNGTRGSLQRMYDAKPAFGSGFDPQTLAEADLLAVQQQHVLDWLLSNHDGHLEQFLRLPDGSLVGIDKGQGFRWFGQDRLDWNFHPNAAYGAPPPVYNALWRDFATGGKAEVFDPRTGPLAEFITRVQNMADDDLKALLRPYAEQAAARGRLAVPQPSFPGVVKATIPANDVEAFLDAVVARKNGLADDFTALYTKAAKARAKAIPGWKPPKVTKATPAKGTEARGKARWKGAPQPTPPEPPKAPEQATAAVFDGWLAKAEARYQANPNKAKANLQATANWPRFRRVVEDLDLGAVDELEARQYLDAALADEARALIAKAAKVKADAEAAYKTALAAHEKAVKTYRKDLADWREANGIRVTVRGMDDANGEQVLRHGTNAAGVTWGKKVYAGYRWTSAERAALREYTGGIYRTWNGQLRRTNGDPGAYKASLDKIDSAMAKSFIPEDVILHRGTGTDAFTVGGVRLGGFDGHRLSEIVGTVQMDHGYMSTSVGNSAAFGGQVQLVVRAPAGTRGAYVEPVSHYGESERELILARGTHLYVHAAYKNTKGGWTVEAEVVEPGFVPPTNPDGSPLTSPARKGWFT
jgi:SPP1 gp7 family putative phage head morphogenesis protein